MKEDKTYYLLEAMLVSLSKARTHLNVGLTLSVIGIVYIVTFSIYVFYGEISTVNLLLVWATIIVIYFAQSRARREYDKYMEEYNKLNKEYEDIVSR